MKIKLIVSFVILFSQVCMAQVDLEAIEKSFVEAVKKVESSAVVIEGGAFIGSGVVIDEGRVLTCAHIIDEYAKNLSIITYKGEKRRIGHISLDKMSDLAIVRVNTHGLKVAKLEDVSSVEIGQWAFTIGNPYGRSKKGQTVFSYGVIKSLDQYLSPYRLRSYSYYDDLIQFTGDIYKGNSGGPLFGVSGKVRGIVCASDGTGKLAFALPIDKRTKFIIDKLKNDEPIEYGVAGIVLVETRHGAEVLEIVEDTCASEADLKIKDVIIKYRRSRIDSIKTLSRKTRGTPIGEKVSIVLIRDGKVIETIIQTSKRGKQ